MRIAILFDNLGPYHVARLCAASQSCELLAIQVRRQSRDYAWLTCPQTTAFRQVTLEKSESGGFTRRFRFGHLRSSLREFAPQCVFVPGWSNPYALAALHWCGCNRVPAVIMSESTEEDLPRARWRESIKSQIVRSCSAGFVGGSAHVDYLARLGLPPERTFHGYDAVDNDYFSQTATKIRNQSASFRNILGVPNQFFLASARFIPSKNLPYLLAEYARYRAAFFLNAPVSGAGCPWSLVLLGDGPGRAELENLIAKLDLRRFILLPGFKQYPELPFYYALAGAFVHVSSSEPWGLVVNEAMASALPVIVSQRCGCARDLVRDGVNGFSFDTTRAGQLAQMMLKISASESLRIVMGSASLDFISGWGLERFRHGFETAAETALRCGPAELNLRRRFILRCLRKR